MVCNGKLSAEYRLSLGMPSNRIFTGGNPAENKVMREHCKKISGHEKENFRQALGLETPVFLHVGRMIKRKGVAELLRGWEVYKNENCRVGSLLLVGEGDELDSLKLLTEKRQLQSVHFMGGIDYEKIACFYAVADVFILATLEDNWSLTVPEAMACGLPVACSRYDGCWPELVKNGENGIVFDPLKPEDVANSLKFFSDRQDVLKDMGKLSVDIVSEFTPQRAALAVLKACEFALSKRTK